MGPLVLAGSRAAPAVGDAAGGGCLDTPGTTAWLLGKLAAAGAEADGVASSGADAGAGPDGDCGWTGIGRVGSAVPYGLA
jgi:hypothetical protein